MKKYFINVFSLILFIFIWQLSNNVALALHYEVKGKFVFPQEWRPPIKNANGQVTIVDVDDKFKLLTKKEFVGPTSSDGPFDFSVKSIEENKINFSHTYRCVVLLHVNQADNKYSQYWEKAEFKFKEDVSVKDLGVITLEIIELKELK